MKFCEIAWCRLKQDVFLWKVKRSHVRVAIPAAAVEHRLERTGKHFLWHPKWEMPTPNLDLVVPVLTPHPGLALQMQIIKCLGEKEEQFCFKISSTLPWCSVLRALSKLLLGQPSPGSTAFVWARAEAEPGEAPAVLETPKQQQQQLGSTTCVLQKNPYSPPSQILLISPQFVQTGNCYRPL